MICGSKFKIKCVTFEFRNWKIKLECWQKWNRKSCRCIYRNVENLKKRKNFEISISNRSIPTSERKLSRSLLIPIVHFPRPSTSSIGQLKNSPSQSTSSRIGERGAADNELKARRLSYRELVTEKSIGYEKRSMKIGAACQTSTVARREKGHRLSSVSIKFPSSTPSLSRSSGNPVYLQDRTCPFDFPATNRLTEVRGDTLEVFFTRRRKELDIPELEDL